MEFLVTLVAILVLLVPGALAVTYEYEFGNGAAESSGSYDIGGAASVSLTGNAETAEAKNHAFVSGPFASVKQANSGNGKAHAYSSFSVKGPTAKTTYEFTGSATDSFARMRLSLSSTTADTINVYGHAWNSQGDSAEARIVATSPSNDQADLLGYWNDAAASQGTASYACIRQGCSYAQVDDYYNGLIYTELIAKDVKGDYSYVQLKLPYGTINKYPCSPYNNAIAYASITENSGKGRAYAFQSLNGAGRVLNNAGAYRAWSYTKSQDYGLKQDIDYYTTGTRTVTQYASAYAPTLTALNS